MADGDGLYAGNLYRETFEGGADHDQVKPFRSRRLSVL